MQTYSIEAAQANFVSLLHRAAHEEALLITENDKPIAKIGPPATDAESYRERVRALRGFLKGMDTNLERDEEDRV